MPLSIKSVVTTDVQCLAVWEDVVMFNQSPFKVGTHLVLKSDPRERARVVEDLGEHRGIRIQWTATKFDSLFVGSHSVVFYEKAGELFDIDLYG